ncbi:MAG: MFS transporter [Planctomycetota bacterium]
MPRRDSTLRSTLRLSTTEGVFAQIHFTIAGAGSIFLVKFAELLGAGPIEFGLVAALAQLSQVFQPLGVAITRRLTRRNGAVVWLAGISRALTLAIGFLPFVLPLDVALLVFLVLIFISMSLQQIAGNAWTGMMADTVPLRIRGRFFAARNRMLMVFGFAASLIAAKIVDDFTRGRDGSASQLLQWVASLTGGTDTHVLLHVFALIFVVGAAIGGVGLMILRKQRERPKEVEHVSTRAQLNAPFHDRRFLALLVFSLWWLGACGIASSFWQPFMLQNLRMTMVDTQLCGMISTIAAVTFLRPWGRFIDRYGNKPAMRLAIVMGFMNPMAWLFVTPGSVWIVYCESATSGIMWAGAGLVMTNLVLAVAPPAKQQAYAGVLGALSGVMMMATTMSSASFLPPPMELFGLHLSSPQVLFFIGGLARLSAQIPLTFVHEPGSVRLVTAMRQVTANLLMRFRPRMMPNSVVGGGEAANGKA